MTGFRLLTVFLFPFLWLRLRLAPAALVALGFLAGLANSVRAENVISATATDAGCSIIAISGTITLDSGYMIQNECCGPVVTVEIWINEGKLLEVFEVDINNRMFDGNSDTAYSPGTYYVRVLVSYTQDNCTFDLLSVVTTVTVN